MAATACKFVKDPTDVYDYAMNWATWLGVDTIDSSTWAIAPAGLTEDSESETATVATVWVSAGTDGVEYTLSNSIVTVAGRKAKRSMIIDVGDL